MRLWRARLGSGCRLPDADHPDIEHRVARRGILRMGQTARNHRDAVVRDFIDVLTHEAAAEALRMIKFVEVDLRLRMMMRRIAAPNTRKVGDFSQHHVGIRRALVIQDRRDLALGRRRQLALAEELFVDVGFVVRAGKIRRFSFCWITHLAVFSKTSVTGVFRQTCRQVASSRKQF